MPDQGKTAKPQMAELAADLKARIGSLVDALVQKDEEEYESEFAHLLGRVRELVERKLRMEGTKTDTRDFLGELLFTRLRRGMHLFMRDEEGPTPQRAAEWVMGVVFPIATLSEFAKAFDQSLIRSSSADKDFNFAGRTDFIAVEEVMQMLCSGKHLGCLSLEKGDNRLDIYLRDGRIFFLDPHRMIRRVLPGDSMRHREIPEAAVTEAENRRAREGVPVLVTLHEKGLFRREELREVMRMFGKEILFDFMRELEPYAFYYRKLETLPQFAEQNDLRLGVTSMLLEGSKQLDDWKQMLQVFPDPDAPLEPKSDMFERMGDVALGVLEIKLLSHLNGDTTPRSLVTVLGLPLYEVYQILIRLSREGIISAGGGAEALEAVTLSMDDSMQQAFEALDANDDGKQRRSAIDRVFGGDDEQEPADGVVPALDRALGGGQKPSSAKPAAAKPGAAKPAAAKPTAAKQAPKEKEGGDLDRDVLDLLRKGTKG